MLDSRSHRLATLPPGCPPVLAIVVDTEEEFDWSRPLSRENTSVRSITEQWRAQEVFGRYGVVPTYAVDYPVATDAEAVRHLKGFLDKGGCEIGAHLHPWVNPPHEEAVTPHNSYPGNLPLELERAKLEALTKAIADAFGQRPTVYKAGRYGIGPNTASLLEALGYTIDTSVVPFTSFAADGGPDFSNFGPSPFLFRDSQRLFEVPTTCGFHGLFSARGRDIYPSVAGPTGMRLRIPGILARLGLLERIRLTPEGNSLAELRRLTRSLLARGQRVFCLSYHSPSLAPGNTPYLRVEQDVIGFLATIDLFLKFFTEEIGGRPATVGEVYSLLRGNSVQ